MKCFIVPFLLLSISTITLAQELEIEPNDLFPVKMREGSFQFDIRNSGTSTFGVDSVATLQIGHGGGKALVGLVFDAMSGDFQGLDYGSLYQLPNGDLELKNRSSNDVVVVTSNSREVRITSEGDVYLDTPGSGLIMKAATGGQCYKLSIDSSGSLTTQITGCPN